MGSARILHCLSNWKLHFRLHVCEESLLWKLHCSCGAFSISLTSVGLRVRIVHFHCDEGCCAPPEWSALVWFNQCFYLAHSKTASICFTSFTFSIKSSHSQHNGAFQERWLTLPHEANGNASTSHGNIELLPGNLINQSMTRTCSETEIPAGGGFIVPHAECSLSLLRAAPWTCKSLSTRCQQVVHTPRCYSAIEKTPFCDTAGVRDALHLMRQSSPVWASRSCKAARRRSVEIGLSHTYCRSYPPNLKSSKGRYI